ncbi:MAG TPA: sulfatase [Polyangiaceae bacterium]
MSDTGPGEVPRTFVAAEALENAAVAAPARHVLSGVWRFLAAGFAGGCGATLVEVVLSLEALRRGQPEGLGAALALAALVYGSCGALLGALGWLFVWTILRLKLDEAGGGEQVPSIYQHRMLAGRATIVGLCLLGMGITLGRVLEFAMTIPTAFQRMVLITLAACLSAVGWLLLYRVLVARVVEFARLSRPLLKTLVSMLLVAALVNAALLLRNPADPRTYWAAALIGFALPSLVVGLRPRWVRGGRPLLLAIGVISVALLLTVARSPYQALYLLRIGRTLPTLFIRVLPMQAPPRAYAELDDLVERGFLARHRSSHPPVVVRSVEKKPNILLITIDALRADRVRASGSAAVPVMPELEAFARGASHFTRHFSAASATVPSLSQLMTGLPGHRLEYLNVSPGTAATLDPGGGLVARSLRLHGYRTHAFLTPALVASFPSVALGFDEIHRENAAGRPLSWARDSVEHILSVLERSHGPAFFWTHLMDLHDRHGAEPGTRWARAYDGSAKSVDAELGRLFAAMRRLPEWNDALVIVTADHGEGLGEARLETHGICQPLTLAVPLVIRFPGGAPEVVDATTGHLDLAPTLLAAIGLSTTGFVGRDLRTMPRNEAWPAARATFEQAIYTRSASPTEVGIVAYPWFLAYDVRGRFPVLIDLAADPAGLANRAGQGLPEERTMRALLEAAWREH